MSTATHLEYPLALKEQAKALLDSLTPDPPPLRLADGVLRVGRTRVSLDTVLGAFRRGWSPSVILRKYPSLELVDIHTTITCYLRHQEIIDAYLEERRRFAEAVQREIEAESAADPWRERLLARPAARE